LRSSVYRRPVPKKFWLAMIDDQSTSQQKEAYRVLCDRALVEKESTDIRQHNLIRAIAYNFLQADRFIWHTTERQAADLWLTGYELVPAASNLETVRGYLEAFEHYCEIEDWDASSTIYSSELVSTNQPLHAQLLIWGYYKELMAISQRLVDKTTVQIKRICLNQIGNSYSHLGKIEQSINYYHRALQFARKICDRWGEGNALGNLGNAYYGFGKYERAIDFHQQYMTIAQKIGNRRGEGNALGSLGTMYRNLGQYERAIDFHQQHLTIAHEIGDRQGKGIALGSLGIAYSSLGKYKQAIDFHKQHLRIAREIGNLQGEGISLNNLGASQIKLEQYQDSLINIQKALGIFREIGNKANEAEALKSFAELHQALGKSELGYRYCQQALALSTELGIPLAEECRKLQEEIEARLSIASG
jgi:tetratricopeptide (TPR) repeat protein